ncbi:MAG: hypothetical protein R2705_21905, partial [Ilumatobacteraceae bacterium]
ASSATHVLVDVEGWFTGEYRPQIPQRVLETRAGAGLINHTGARPRARSRVVVPVGTTRPVALNVTAVDPAGEGFLTVYACDDAMPTASNVNYTARQTIPNSVVITPSAQGTVCIYTYAEADLVVDLQGSFDFNFVGVTPRRVLETRAGAGQIGFSGNRPSAGAVVQVATGAGGASAVALNVTAVGPREAGYLTVWPCGTPRPDSSNLNYVRGQTIANLVVVHPGADGLVCISTVRGHRLGRRPVRHGEVSDRRGPRGGPEARGDGAHLLGSDTTGRWPQQGGVRFALA